MMNMVDLASAHLRNEDSFRAPDISPQTNVSFVGNSSVRGKNANEPGQVCPEIRLSKRAGRFGNVIVQIVHALDLAENLGGALVKIEQPVLEQIQNVFDIPPGTFSIQTKPQRTSSCGHLPPGICNRLTEDWGMRCKTTFANRKRLVQDYLAPHLQKTITRCAADFNKNSNDTLVVHLRGGDLTRPKPTEPVPSWHRWLPSFLTGVIDHVIAYFFPKKPAPIREQDLHPGCHKQPSCSFYDDVMGRSETKFKTIVIATDGHNQCEEQIKRRNNGKGVRVARSNEVFEHMYDSDPARNADITDVCVLLGGKHVAFARSTFSAAAMLLNPFREEVFLPLAYDSEDFCDVWNNNQAICPYVKEGYFFYPEKWKGTAHEVDNFAATCHEHLEDLGEEPQ